MPPSSRTLVLSEPNRDKFREKITQDFYPDVMLRVVGLDAHRFISAHRAILASYSKYFDALFSSGMKETGAHIVEVQEESADALEQVVSLLYNCSIQTESEDHLLQLLRVSHKYQVDEVTRLLDAMAAEYVTKKSLAQYLDLVHTLQLVSAIQGACFRVASKVLMSERLEVCVGLTPEMLTSVLHSDELQVDEAAAFLAVLSWLKFTGLIGKPELRLTLLREIRLENLTEQEVRSLWKTVSTQHDIACEGIGTDMEALVGRAYVMRIQENTRPRRQPAPAKGQVAGTYRFAYLKRCRQ